LPRDQRVALPIDPLLPLLVHGPHARPGRLGHLTRAGAREQRPVHAGTIRAYTDDGALFAVFLARQGMPTAARSIRQSTSRRSSRPSAPSSAATRYRSLQQLFSWQDEEGEIDGSPMPRRARQRSPRNRSPCFPTKMCGAYWQPSYEYPGGLFGFRRPPGDGVPGQLVAAENLRATRLPTVSVTATVVVWTTSCQACLLN